MTWRAFRHWLPDGSQDLLNARPVEVEAFRVLVSGVGFYGLTVQDEPLALSHTGRILNDFGSCRELRSTSTRKADFERSLDCFFKPLHRRDGTADERSFLGPCAARSRRGDVPTMKCLAVLSGSYILSYIL